MKWFGLLVAGFITWVLVRAFVPALLLVALAGSFLVAIVYKEVTPLIATGVIGLLYLSHIRSRHGS